VVSLERVFLSNHSGFREENCSIIIGFYDVLEKLLAKRRDLCIQEHSRVATLIAVLYVI